MNAIEINNLTKNYKDFSINNMNFAVPTGSIVGLVGGNGAGKSTTIKLIMDTIKRDSGSISVLGIDNKQKEFINAKENIGIVLDETNFPDMLNAKNINSIMKLTYKNWDNTMFSMYMEKFNLPKNKPFKEFSRGMRMKLGIAVALSHNAKLLILDEATSGLDPLIRDEILEVFSEFTRNEKNTVLMSSHIVSDLEKICDYIAFMNNGEIILYEEKDVLLDTYGVLKISKNDLQNLSNNAIIAKKATSYGYDILVKKNEIPNNLVCEITTLEDIILFLAKERK